MSLTPRVIVRQHPFASFMVLAYGLSWFGWLLNMVLPSPYWPAPILPFGPLLAAIIVTALTGGGAAVKALLGKLVQWRVAPGWYLFALLTPVIVTAASGYLTVWSGAPGPTAAQLGAWTGLFLLFPFQILLNGPLGEELGWRGWALPWLQARWSPLVSSLILGGFWAGWHLPLFIVGEAPWPLFLGIIAASVSFTWLYNRTNGSVLLAMLFHGAQNTIGGPYVSRMFTGADSVKQIGFMSALYGLLAVAIVVAGGMPRRRPAQAASVAPRAERLQA